MLLLLTQDASCGADTLYPRVGKFARAHPQAAMPPEKQVHTKTLKKLYEQWCTSSSGIPR